MIYMYLTMLVVLLLGRDCVSEYLVCQLSSGASCPRFVYPNTALLFICNIEAQQLGLTAWLLPNGTCTNQEYTERIVLLQPKYGGCNPSSSSQHGTCGPFTAQNVASSGCVNSSLSVVATQGLNGAVIKCMNYDGSSLFHIGNATISIVGSEISIADASVTAAIVASMVTTAASSCPSMLAADTAAICSSIGTAVGVSVSVASVVSFSMGVLAASVLCYISRRSKESSHKPSSCGDPATVYEVGTNKKMKEDVFELNTNNTYGSPTVQEVGTNKEMERDVLELNTNTAYGSHVSSTVHEVGTNKEMEGDVVKMRANTSYVSVYH